MINNQILAFNLLPSFNIEAEENYDVAIQCLLDGFAFHILTGCGWKTIKLKMKDCFGFYDDGDNECEACTDSNTCFHKGVI